MNNDTRNQRCQNLRVDYRREPLGLDNARPRLSWLPPESGDRPCAIQVLVANGLDQLTEADADLWNSGILEGDLPMAVEYAGAPLTSRRRVWWTVRVRGREGSWCDWAEPASFEIALLAESDWSAQWIGNPSLAYSGATIQYPRFRSRFRIDSGVRWARLYVAACGYALPWINGRPVEGVILEPQVSRYDRQAYAFALDVSEYLKPGTNSLGFELSSGFYNTRTIPGSLGYPLVRAQLEVINTIFHRQVVGTDDTWQTGPGPRMHLGHHEFMDYGGEIHTALNDDPGWMDADSTACPWRTAVAVENPTRTVRFAPNAGNVVTECLEPVDCRRIDRATLLFDFGRIITGRLRFTLGTGAFETNRLIIRYLEEDPWAEPVSEQIPYFRQADIIDLYRQPPGEEPFAWESRFGYRSFRYICVQQEGHLFGRIADEPFASFRVDQLSNELGDRSTAFSCDDPLLESIESVNRESIRNLTLGGVVVDCQNREKYGYGQEAMVALKAGMIQFECADLARKILLDWRADQHPGSGLMPKVSPAFSNNFGMGGGPIYGHFPLHLSVDACLQTGDRRFLSEQWESSRAYFDYLLHRIAEAGDGLVPAFVPGEDGEDLPITHRLDEAHVFFVGDWLTPEQARPGFQPQTIPYRRRIATLHTLYALRQFVWATQQLGETGMAEDYRARADELAAGLRERFRNTESGVWGDGTQAEQAMAYTAMADADEAARGLTVEALRGAIAANDDRLSTGVLGTYHLLLALTEAREADLALTVITREGGPSWGDMIRQGYRSFWEAWSKTRRPRLHTSYTSVGAWFYEALGGILTDPEFPGFRRFLLRPQVPASLKRCEVSRWSPHGSIASGWERDGDRITYRFQVPPGSEATVHLPHGADQADGPGPIGERGPSDIAGYEAIDLSTGSYRFTTDSSD